MGERPQSFGEEIANSVSHGVALLATVAATPVLIIAAVQRGVAEGIVGASVFSATMVLMYLTSTLYHALPRNRAKQVFQILDHGAIFLLIAGTYTPFTLGVLRGMWGWTLFGLVWSLALTGIVLKIVYVAWYQRFSTFLYLVMGWLVVIALKVLLLHVSTWGLIWLLSGGLAYTVGVVFFLVDERIRYSHFIWHLFVIAGTSCHFIAVLRYSA
ncbi:MAG TPA: hemolysin III family protein [Alphaproteobacteria bacterium]|nr:hemolysin III family protein [Alphaproteobacteria bacterium]HIN62893.1 hemolysin III family protein [Candidatus Neomarinimicrobiota bacterium]HIO68568.1 hemolysin III family protein [Flavobacteriales bacterium]HIO79064.1 hemolysin III family protein [Candidatus Poribacteria bacterium]